MPPLITRWLILQQAHGQHCMYNTSHILYPYGFTFYFTPQRGSFSPFLRSTASLSVIMEYLALRGGPRVFIRGFTCPILLGVYTAYALCDTGLSPSLVQDSIASHQSIYT